MSAFMILNEDEALKSYLSGITVSDGNNATRPVHVRFNYRDIESKDDDRTDWPFTLISLTDMYPDTSRKHSGGRYYTTEFIEGETAPTPNQVMVRQLPMPYILEYQITTFARHARHDREILQKYARKFPMNDGVMPLTAPLNDIYRPLFHIAFDKILFTEGQGNEAKRTYRNSWVIHVPTELDPDIVEATNLVLTPRLNVTTQYVPTNLDTP